MAMFKVSGKLSGRGGEYLLYSGRTVFFRVIDLGETVAFMTATADEGDGVLRAYSDQAALQQQTTRLLEERGFEAVPDQDQQRRPFVRASLPADDQDVEHYAAMILDRLDIKGDLSVRALREMRELHSDIAIDDDEDGYLGDGVYITPEGRVIGG